jgi:hypothetical protein
MRKLSLLVLGVALAASAHATGIAATATYSYTEPSAGVFDYSITLHDTGSTPIGTFWFSWVPGTGFLSAVPTDLTSPAGWTETLKPAAAGKVGIQWTSTTPTDDLDSGMTLTGFSFESTETPAELLLDFGGTGPDAGDRVTTSTVYAGAPLMGTADTFVATPVPEPGTMLLTLSGLILAAASFKSRLLRKA